MAQTASAMSFKDCEVKYTTDGGTTWTDASGFASVVTVSGGERNSAEAYTFDGDVAIIGKGKRAPLNVTATVIYTEGSTDPFSVLLPYYQAGSSVGLRWTPRGLSSASGEWVYTSTYTGSVFKSLSYPAGEANSANPLTVQVTVLTPSIATSTQA
jgi:hypothetical protein